MLSEKLQILALISLMYNHFKNARWEILMVLLKLLLPFLVNGGFDLSENTQMYYNAAYVYKVNSFANYRTHTGEHCLTFLI
jgi:hypothetical protein